MTGVHSTHDLQLADGVVVKRFRSWDRGEHRREWAALRLLGEYAPGLAPAPLEADLAADPPVVSMGRLPGRPLRETPIEARQLSALAAAIGELHGNVPRAVAGDLAQWFSPVVLAEKARQLHRDQSRPADSLALQAFDAGGGWLASGVLPGLIAAEVEPVFGHGDGNLANYLWDGERVRLVDFEDSGRSDRAFELAELVEHLSAIDAGLDVSALLARFELTAAERARLGELRRLSALNWFLMLLPGGPAHVRNPPEALHRQAIRLLDLLG